METGMPEGFCVRRGEWRGMAQWECCVRKRSSRGGLCLRFPLWEGAEEVNDLLREGMERLYRRAEERGTLSLHYALAEEGECLQVSLLGRVGEGPREEWARVYVGADGSWQGYRRGKRRRKTDERDRTRAQPVDKRRKI